MASSNIKQSTSPVVDPYLSDGTSDAYDFTSLLDRMTPQEEEILPKFHKCKQKIHKIVTSSSSTINVFKFDVSRLNDSMRVEFEQFSQDTDILLETIEDDIEKCEKLLFDSISKRKKNSLANDKHNIKSMKKVIKSCNNFLEYIDSVKSKLDEIVRESNKKFMRLFESSVNDINTVKSIKITVTTNNDTYSNIGVGMENDGIGPIDVGSGSETETDNEMDDEKHQRPNMLFPLKLAPRDSILAIDNKIQTKQINALDDGKGGRISDVAILHDNLIVAVSSYAQRIITYDNGEIYQTDVKYIPSSVCAISSNNKVYVGVGQGRFEAEDVYIYEYNIGQKEYNLLETLKHSHVKAVTQLQFVENNGQTTSNAFDLVSLSSSICIFWDINGQSPVSKFSCDGGASVNRFYINDNSISNDLLLFYISNDGYIYVSMLETGTRLVKFKTTTTLLNCIDFSFDNKFLMVGGGNPNLFVVYAIDWKRFGAIMKSKLDSMDSKKKKKKGSDEKDVNKLFSVVYKASKSKDAVQDVRFLKNSGGNGNGKGKKSNVIIWRIYKENNIHYCKYVVKDESDSDFNKIKFNVKTEDVIDNTHESIIWCFEYEKNSKTLVSGDYKGTICFYNIDNI